MHPVLPTKELFLWKQAVAEGLMSFPITITELHNRTQGKVFPSVARPHPSRGGAGSVLHFSCSLSALPQLCRSLFQNLISLAWLEVCTHLECNAQMETFTLETMFASQCSSQWTLLL